jgi:hypothetical protein
MLEQNRTINSERVVREDGGPVERWRQRWMRDDTERLSAFVASLPRRNCRSSDDEKPLPEHALAFS